MRSRRGRPRSAVGRSEAPEPPVFSGRAPAAGSLERSPLPAALRIQQAERPSHAECGLEHGPGPTRPGAGRWRCWSWAARGCATPALNPSTPRNPEPGTSKCAAPLLVPRTARLLPS